ncbi:MAG: hypothetical protein LBF24_00420 [Puniceicoccales bacterium]|nr:hypothetical protein [Puniceicoccales bacterium]
MGRAVRSFFRWIGWNLGLCERERTDTDRHSAKADGVGTDESRGTVQ